MTLNMKTVAVISAYNNSIEWSLKLLEEKIVDKIYVYSHKNIIHENPFVLKNELYYYEEIPNKGCEASSYLKYIIDNYNNLPERIILIHDHEFSWHHEGSIIDLIKKNIIKDVDYININSFYWENIRLISTPEYDCVDEWQRHRIFYSLYKHFLEPYYGDLQLFLNFKEGHKGCAQFILRRNCITRNPCKLYVDLYNYCMNNFKIYGHIAYGFGYFMEYTWHIIFGHIVPLKKIMKGKWKYSSRFVYMNDEYILCDLRNNNNEWISAQIPIQYEDIIYNDNGIPTMEKT